VTAPDAKIKIEAETDHGLRIWRCSGEIVIESGILIREWAERDLNAGHRKFAVDMSKITYANSAGIGALAKVINEIHQKNGRICFFNFADSNIRRVFEILPGFEIFNTIDECKEFFLGLTPPMLYIVLEQSRVTNAAINDALTRFGKDKGYNIKTYDDPDEAYEFMSEVTNPRLIVIVDGMHPKAMSFVRRIKGHPESSKRYPVMVVVSPGRIDEVLTMVSDMADDFIMSPPNPQELVLRLNQLRMKLSMHDPNKFAG